MRDLRSTGFQWQRDWERTSNNIRDEIATREHTAAIGRQMWLNGTHPAQRHLRDPAPPISSPWSLLKLAGPGVIVLTRTIICFIGITDVRYNCFQHSLAAEVALSYARTTRKNKKKVVVIINQEPTTLPVADVSVTSKMHVQLVPCLSNTQITKYCSGWVPTKCNVGVAKWIPEQSTFERDEVLIMLPISLENEAVGRGALVHVRNDDTVVIRVQRDKALNKALNMYFKVPHGIAYKLSAACVERIQSFLS